MTRWNGIENPDRHTSGNPHVEQGAEKTNQNNNSTEKKTLEEQLKESSNENISPRERLARLNGKMDQIKEEAGQAFPDMSTEKRQELIKRLVKDKPPEQVLEEIEGDGNALDDAEQLADQSKAKGVSRSARENIEPYSHEDKRESYSRSGDANAVDKKGKQRDKAHDKARKVKYGKGGDPRVAGNDQPDW